MCACPGRPQAWPGHHGPTSSPPKNPTPTLLPPSPAVDRLREVLDVLRSLADPERLAGGQRVGLDTQLPRRLMLRAAHRLAAAEEELEGLRGDPGAAAGDEGPLPGLAQGDCSCSRQGAWSWLPTGVVGLRNVLCVFACQHHRLLTLALVLEGLAALCLTMYWLGAHGVGADGDGPRGCAAARSWARPAAAGGQAPTGSITLASEHVDDCREPLLSSS